MVVTEMNTPIRVRETDRIGRLGAQADGGLAGLEEYLEREHQDANDQAEGHRPASGQASPHLRGSSPGNECQFWPPDARSGGVTRDG
jgi:hypothetical protein